MKFEIGKYYVVTVRGAEEPLIVEVMDEKDGKVVVADVITGDIYELPPDTPGRAVTKIEQMLLDAFGSSEYYSEGQKSENESTDRVFDRAWKKVLEDSTEEAKDFILLHQLGGVEGIYNYFENENCPQNISEQIIIKCLTNSAKFVEKYAPSVSGEFSNLADEYIRAVKRTEDPVKLSEKLRDLDKNYLALSRKLEEEIAQEYKEQNRMCEGASQLFKEKVPLKVYVGDECKEYWDDEVIIYWRFKTKGDKVTPEDIEEIEFVKGEFILPPQPWETYKKGE